MASENKTDLSEQNKGLSSRNALIIKIALFLSYLSKENHLKLLYDLQQQKNNPEIDILKFMPAKNYISQSDMFSLKKACLNFARTQEDIRFGSLCINFDFLTLSNLTLALEEQQKLAEQGRNIMLGDLLVDAGMISDRQRNLILQKQKLEGNTRKNTRANEISGSTDENETSVATPAFDRSRMREIRENEIIILIQHDGLKAFIIKTDNFDSSVTLTDFKLLVEKYGIIYGLVDDESLGAFIKNHKYRETFFKIAEGREPVDGIDARVDYTFERDYLKPGQFAEDGFIDFKERGKIPFVSEGAVLAEKIPPVEGKDGVNIYGDAIPFAGGRDISFIMGKGVHLSEDGLKVISNVSGTPKVKQNGEISVNDDYFIEGDVDYTTGHVKFDKNVYITGSIKNGFRVEAFDVVVDTIDGGVVKAHGDVFVQNGITAAVVEARGSIKAGFLIRSKAVCMGNMNIVKEIVHSEVIVEGTLEIPRGRTFSSSITAKGGAKIYTIGSEKANPSVITVGTSAYFEKELLRIDSLIEDRQNLLETRTAEKGRIESELTIIIEKQENSDDSRQHTISINDEKTLLEAHLRKINRDIAICTEDVKNSVQEKFALKRIDQANSPKAVLEVEGKVLAGTRICGRYSGITLKESMSRTRIMEINIHSDDGKDTAWEMVTAHL